MSRTSFKVVGSQGQGVNSVGEMCAKGLKRSGYCVFAYREYMSLIKGGHSSYQLDIDNKGIRSTEMQVDILVCLNHHGLEENIRDVKSGGVILHVTPDWKFPIKDKAHLMRKKIKVIYFPIDDILKKLKARPILANVLLTTVLWSLLGQKKRALKKIVREQFGHKGEKVIEKNFQCIDEAETFKSEQVGDLSVDLPKANSKWKKHMLLTGSEAMGLGIIHAGCRVYVGYPMTPSSPLLSFIAKMQNRTGMVIKQAEDEITAAQMMSGAMHMGTRAATATSGGGFDLMTETVSLNGIIENPSIFVVAQRPGPATGLPTWTGQGDLMLVTHAAHGEFPRCVIGVSDSQDAFDLMPVAFNIAEKYQISVIVLTDKQIAEALWTQKYYKQNAKIDRGQLVTDRGRLKRLKGTDRFNPAATDGISPRWLPGTKAETYCAQGDEHNADGSVDESAENAELQMSKRMKKVEVLKKDLPEPVLYGAKRPEILLVGWGSTKGPVLDVLDDKLLETESIGYLHYSYLWPLKTKTFERLHKRARKVIAVEGNYQGQLGMLLQQESCLPVDGKILKYDGRPFFYEELRDLIFKHI